MNEAETRAEHIDPALKAAGWGKVAGSRIRREYPITLGRLEGQGRRAKALTADYLLIYRNTSLAVIEAKAWDEPLTLGVQQAKNYATKLSIRHAFATNGRGVYGIDMQTGSEGEQPRFPRPDELWLTFANRMDGAIGSPQCRLKIRAGSSRGATSLKDGINDGFLTPFKVKQIATTLDEYVFTPDDHLVEGEVERGRLYKESDFNRIIEIREREAHRVRLFMSMIDPKEKTLVFCATQEHALVVRDLINQTKVSADPNYCVRVTAEDGALGDQYLRDFQDNEKSITGRRAPKLQLGMTRRRVCVLHGRRSVSAASPPHHR